MLCYVVPLALAIFHETTSAAITSYFPERSCASNFLKLINVWWVVSNSKTEFNSNNRLGNAAILGDNNPTFLRALADWIEHGLLIEYGPICHIVKLPISMIRPFSLVNNSHITLYPQLEIIWKLSKSLRKYWEKYGQISYYIISCITRDCIIVENIYLV